MSLCFLAFGLVNFSLFTIKNQQRLLCEPCALCGKNLFMKSATRREVIDTAQTLVVKIGTNVLSREDGRIDPSQIERFADQIHAIKQTGRQVLLVSSGAVGVGMERLGLEERPKELPHLQAVAATGQAHLIRLYDQAFQRHGYHASQVLLTAEDFQDRTRYLNIRNTIRTLFEYGTIPVINENDTVSTAEIKFGDNDALASMVTYLIESPLLIILSSVDGLYNGDPKDPNSQIVRVVDHWSPAVLEMAQPTKTRLGTGGMQSKLSAIRSATQVGESVILAHGRHENVLLQILNGDDVGTLFLAEGQSVSAWKRWIGYTVKTRGTLVVDAGAVEALTTKGKSLLAIGIKDIQGTFDEGEVLSIVGPEGYEFARGLSNYSSVTLRQIQGKTTKDIQTLLGPAAFGESVHRDNLVVTRRS